MGGHKVSCFSSAFALQVGGGLSVSGGGTSGTRTQYLAYRSALPGLAVPAIEEERQMHAA